MDAFYVCVRERGVEDAIENVELSLKVEWIIYYRDSGSGMGRELLYGKWRGLNDRKNTFSRSIVNRIVKCCLYITAKSDDKNWIRFVNVFVLVYGRRRRSMRRKSFAIFYTQQTHTRLSLSLFFPPLLRHTENNDDYWWWWWLSAPRFFCAAYLSLEIPRVSLGKATAIRVLREPFRDEREIMKNGAMSARVVRETRKLFT